MCGILSMISFGLGCTGTETQQRAALSENRILQAFFRKKAIQGRISEDGCLLVAPKWRFVERSYYKIG